MLGKELTDEHFTDIEKQQIVSNLCTRGKIQQQIEHFDNLWNKLILDPSQATLLRLLRINLRKLRSALVLLQPLLPPEKQQWMAFLKQVAMALGEIRDYDVALGDCEKYEASLQEDEHLQAYLIASMGASAVLKLTQLKELLLQKRAQQSASWQQSTYRGYIAEELAVLLALLKRQALLTETNQTQAEAFLQERLQAWEAKLSARLTTLTLATPAAEMHHTRVKIKRYRYAYATYMGHNGNVQLLACLKAAQDVLGSLHDGEHNLAMLQELVNAQPSVDLLQEFQCFKVWREHKLQLRLDILLATRDQLLERMCSGSSVIEAR